MQGIGLQITQPGFLNKAALLQKESEKSWHTEGRKK